MILILPCFRVGGPAENKIEMVQKMNLQEVREVIGTTCGLYNSKAFPLLMIQHEKRLARGVMKHPDVIAVYATGYPHYLPYHHGCFATTEILSHVSRMADRLKYAEGVWPCPSCVEANDHKNLRDPCGQCSLTEFKPHDIFETMPDADVVVIVNKDPTKVEADIWSIADSLGYRPPEANLRNAIRTFPQTVPADINIIALDHLLEQLYDFGASGKDWVNQRAEARILWLKPETRSLWFGLDMLLSFTGVAYKSQRLIEQLNMSRASFRRDHGELDSVLEEIRYATPALGNTDHLARIRRLIFNGAVRYGIAERYNSWGSPVSRYDSRAIHPVPQPLYLQEPL